MHEKSVDKFDRWVNKKEIIKSLIEESSTDNEELPKDQSIYQRRAA